MPQPKRGYALGSNPSHQRLMLRNMARSLFEHERVKTTEAKAKLLRPYAERLITKAKRGGIHDRRQVLSLIEDRAVVHKLFAEIGPRFSARNGGYTRILKIGPRAGDGAPMAFIELVDTAARSGAAVTSDQEPGRRRRLRRRRRPEEAAPVPGTSEPETSTEPAASGESEEPGGPTETPASTTELSSDDSDQR